MRVPIRWRIGSAITIRKIDPPDKLLSKQGTMGVYYYYANHTKREMFPVDCFGGPIKHNGIGRGLGARAFALMLQENHGRWVNDKVVVLGDDHREDWIEIRDSYTNISANAILTVADAGGLEEVLEFAEADERLFMQLCHLIITDQTPNWQSQFEERFGAGYQSRYQKLCLQRQEWIPCDLV